MPCASIYDFISIFFESRNDLGGREYAEHHNIHSHDQIFLLILSEKIQEYQGRLQMLYTNF
jgi:hypothetical protein